MARIVAIYLDSKVDEFIDLVDRLGGVYAGLAFIDFLNGNNTDQHRQRVEPDEEVPNIQFLKLVIPSQWLPNIVDFFNSFADNRIKICTKTNVGKFLQAGGACDCLLTIQHLNVCLQPKTVTPLTKLV